jgi:curli biogenesis system outer membrane secretion channel CsgG
MRVLLACELLDDPGQTVLSVAYTCGYASDSSLRRAVQEFTGVLLTELRKQGAFATASERFLEELEGTRESGRARRKLERQAAREGRTLPPVEKEPEPVMESLGLPRLSLDSAR